MIRVYIAGKLNDMAPDYIKNMHRMMEQAERVRKAGFSVFVPCLDILMGLVFGEWDYEDYFKNSQPWLEVSHAMLVCRRGWEYSLGTQKEIERANKANIPIFFDEQRLFEYFKEELDDK